MYIFYSPFKLQDFNSRGFPLWKWHISCTVYIPYMCHSAIDFISVIVVYEVGPEEWEMKQKAGDTLLWNWCLVVQWSRMYYEWESLNYHWSIMYLLPRLHATYTQIKGWRWWFCSKLEGNNKLEDKEKNC